jgi:hypothetical protein
VSNVRAVDRALAAQLARWPTYREVAGESESEEARFFANHCPHCGAMQEEMYLHSEPEQAFFDIPRAAAGSIKLTPVEGAVRFSGDESFAV